ncbi:MAG: hypothetical protein KF773_30470 [Deltaproteobacteria bacterium]|nr:hypothetical protein [Deltaproteobacteria bacterium]MCW5805678.1 hypothetical protein [Deltaproteobacteria bacterium]
MRIATFAILATAGSATTPRTTMTVTSMTPGTPIFVNDRQVGVTPARLALSAARGHEVTVRGRGGEHTVRIDPRNEGWVVHGVVHSQAWLVDLLRAGDADDVHTL